ncbi:hypothetical protein DDY07_05630 [Methylomonas sp. ZR1]|nr:hypothetical protein [Methylomonas sp. ZR1]
MSLAFDLAIRFGGGPIGSKFLSKSTSTWSGRRTFVLYKSRAARSAAPGCYTRDDRTGRN